METSYFSSRHPVVQLLMSVFILLLSYLAISIISLFPALFIYHVPFSALAGGIDYTNPDYIAFLKYLQISQAFALFIIPPIIIGWFALHDPWKFLQIRKAPESWLIGVVFIILLTALPGLNVLSSLNEGMKLPAFLAGLEDWMQRTEEKAGDLTEAFLTVDNLGGYLVNVLMIALLPAFGEEFLFRGVLQNLFGKWFRNHHWAIWITAIVFSAFHLQFYGFLPRLVLGLIFGYLVFWTGNLWYAIFAHFLNNFMPVTATFLFPERFSPDQLTGMGTGPSDWLWAIPATLVTIGALYYFYLKSRQITRQEESL
jgi:membrane protease YdiL (CAAX protease family)